MDEHIRIGDIAPRVQYLADGTQAHFTYPFPIFAAADLEVRLDGLVLASRLQRHRRRRLGRRQRGVRRARPPRRAASRSAATWPSPAPATSRTNGILRARTLNDELDYQVAALQEVKEELGNALRLDPSEVGGAATLPLPVGPRQPAARLRQHSATSPSSTAARAP